MSPRTKGPGRFCIMKTICKASGSLEAKWRRCIKTPHGQQITNSRKRQTVSTRRAASNRGLCPSMKIPGFPGDNYSLRERITPASGGDYGRPATEIRGSLNGWEGRGERYKHERLQIAAQAASGNAASVGFSRRVRVENKSCLQTLHIPPACPLVRIVSWCR